MYACTSGGRAANTTSGSGGGSMIATTLPRSEAGRKRGVNCYPTESLRNSMTEALISNFAGTIEVVSKKERIAPVGLFDATETGV